MFPNPWATTVPPPAVSKPPTNNQLTNSYENNAQQYPFYAAQNVMQNIAINQQNNLTLNAASMVNKSLQPNAIDPALVQKWQEWKQWELWQHQFQQWQQQTGHIPATATQPTLPPMPANQLSSQPHTIAFQNQQYIYNTQGPPLPQTNPPLPNQQNAIRNDVGIKRGLESDTQNNEKKLKTETTNNKKEIELNVETEALFEEQFKSWEEQFFKWKEQNKNHPDKTQYLEYEKKWLNWRGHLKQKCEALKKKRELKMAEKKKETVQAEEIKLQSQQRLSFNPMMIPNQFNNLTNEQLPSTLQNLHKNNSIISSSENQIPGLDLVSTNENASKGFLNVTRILPQNPNGPMHLTPDDKPFNFPKNITNPLLNIPSHGTINQPSTSVYQNSSNWSNNKYNNPVIYNNQKRPDVDNTSIPSFSQQTDIDSRLPYSGNTSNIMFNNSLNVSNMNYKRPLDGSYNKPSSENNSMYNKPSSDQSYNRNMNTPSDNFFEYNQPNTNTSNFNNFNQVPEKSNISYQKPKPLMNTTPSKPPSLLSLNLVKPIALDKPGNYSENKNVTPNRYEKNWNVSDEYDDPENEYMEAHKKFSSESFDDHLDEDQFSNNKYHRNAYSENHYSRGQQGARNNFNENYSRPFNHSRGSQIMRNKSNEFSRNVGQNYPQETQTSRNNDNSFYKNQNMKIDQGFLRGRAPLSNNDNEEFSNEPIIDSNFIPQKGNYGPSSRGNYGPLSRGNYDLPIDNFGNNKNKTNHDWDNDYLQNERPLQPVGNDIIGPLPITKPPYEAAPPIDPVKIFDYRHLSTLKIIPGLIKETIFPIRIFDHKHGGKRILPWQDRGYSRRNSSNTRDLNEKEGFFQNNIDDLNKNKELLHATKPSVSFIDISVEENLNENKVEKINENITSSKIDTVTIIDDGEENENDQSSPVIETVDMCAPSPPRVSKNSEVEKSPRQLLNIDTLLCLPGRLNRPSKIVIILRGLPGSGKSHVAKLIKEKEVAMGGQAPRILSLDDYFMTEVTKTEIDPETNKKVEIKKMEYEHDSANENLYRTSFIKAFKKKILENYFSFFIIDAINNKVSYYQDILEISKVNGFTVYIIELEADVDLCIKQNIHNRTAHDINNIMKSWVKTPSDQILLDISSLLDSSLQNEMEMEDVSDVEMELDKDEETADLNKSEEDNADIEEEDVMKLLSCKWTDTIPQEEKMKRLDGLCKKKTENSIKEWLQIPEDYTVSDQVVVKDGKKRVRWADMEERREQEKMRAIGFVVGQTDWNRMLGRDQGESKLTQTKYI